MRADAGRPRSSISEMARPLALALPVLSSLVLASWALVRCGYGLEFTDEGFYLNWVSKPSNFDASVTQFGFVFHPVYLLTGGDVALMRRLNVGLLLLLGFLLSYAVFCSIGSRKATRDRPSRAMRVCAALAAASSTLALFSPWLPTPNYNSLTLQSLMLTATGAVLAKRDRSLSSAVGWFLIGVGGGLTFLAKPPSAVVLGLLMPAYLLIAGKLGLRGLCIAVAAAAAVVSLCAIAIDGSLPVFVQRLADGKQLAEILQSGHRLGGIVRLDHLEISDKQGRVFTYFMFAAFLSAGFVLLAGQHVWPWSAATALVVLIFIVLAVTGRLFPNPATEAILANQLLAITIGTGLAWFASPACRALMTRDMAALFVLFLLFPYAYAVGTNTNIWAAAARAGIFWLLAGLVLCVAASAAQRAYEAISQIGTLALLVPCYVLTTAMHLPYRQARALHLQVADTEISGSGAHLFLGEDTAAYVNDLRRAATDAGFRVGDPLIDLTGVSPGASYLLGARPPGVASTFGGYPGSMDYVAAALARTPCEIVAASWVLVEQPPSYAPSLDVLRKFGIDPSGDLTTVASIRLVRQFEPQKIEQLLLKPVRPIEAGKQACENSRHGPAASRN